MGKHVNAIGEILPIKVDYSQYAVALFRVKITDIGTQYLGNLGTFMIRLFRMADNEIYKNDVILHISTVAYGNNTFNIKINDLGINEAVGLNYRVKVVGSYAYFYAKGANAFDYLSYQILFAVNPAFIEPLGTSSDTMTIANFNDTTNSYLPVSMRFPDPTITVTASATKSNDSLVDQLYIQNGRYVHINTRLVIVGTPAANTVLATISATPTGRVHNFFADVTASYGQTTTLTRVPMTIDMSGNIFSPVALAANNNVYIDTIYRFRQVTL
jgi:hypothetical protein